MLSSHTQPHNAVLYSGCSPRTYPTMVWIKLDAGHQETRFYPWWEALGYWS
jgi:hypothetical protein